MKVLSLIPARGGSKGVPRKNIKLLNGKPLIAYTIEASLGAKIIDRTIVSTDDNEIAEIACDFKAEVPFLRPKELAGDTVLDFPVIKHAINYLKEYEGYEPEIVVYLRPTIPLRTSNEINQVIKLLIENKSADCVRTTRPAIYPPYWMKKINNDGYLEPYHSHVKPNVFTRRQDLPKVVMCDGYVDAARVDSVLKNMEFPTGKKLSYYRENIPFIDIDTEEDWNYCEYFFKKGTT
ncbi:MAG: acylneuraminate cytidylyltransferase family protein [Candidatus Marinimicrobia bacterium]|nr:acylneuraminate cytidylyltransferase family protein [Candidatus Neomarinimicrobiota bacterium]